MRDRWQDVTRGTVVVAAANNGKVGLCWCVGSYLNNQDSNK